MRKNLFKISGLAAVILGLLFVISAIGFIVSFAPGSTKEWDRIFPQNWLIVIFKLHAGLIGIQDNPLYGVNFLDMAILLLFSTMSFGLNTHLKKTNKVFSLIAFVISLAAIILFLITHLAGRSTVMLSVLIFSLIMAANKNFSRATIYTGIFAGIFLFTGDLTVGMYSLVITILFGIGYVLLTVWFFLVARILYRRQSQQKI